MVKKEKERERSSTEEQERESKRKRNKEKGIERERKKEKERILTYESKGDSRAKNGLPGKEKEKFVKFVKLQTDKRVMTSFKCKERNDRCTERQIK